VRFAATTFTAKLAPERRAARAEDRPRRLMKVTCKKCDSSHPRNRRRDGRSSRKSSSRHTTSRGASKRSPLCSSGRFCGRRRTKTPLRRNNIYNTTQYVRNSDGVDHIEIPSVGVIDAGSWALASRRTGKPATMSYWSMYRRRARSSPKKYETGLRVSSCSGNAAEEDRTKAVLERITSPRLRTPASGFIIENVTEKWPIKKRSTRGSRASAGLRSSRRRHVRHLHHAIGSVTKRPARVVGIHFMNGAAQTSGRSDPRLHTARDHRGFQAPARRDAQDRHRGRKTCPGRLHRVLMLTIKEAIFPRQDQSASAAASIEFQRLLRAQDGTAAEQPT